MAAEHEYMYERYDELTPEQKRLYRDYAGALQGIHDAMTDEESLKAAIERFLKLRPQIFEAFPGNHNKAMEVVDAAKWELDEYTMEQVLKQIEIMD